MKLDTPEDRTAAAGEYVLGTLTSAEQTAFENAMAGDGGLRAEVGYWQDRLLVLTRHCEPAEALPPGVWGRIEARLREMAQSRQGVGDRPPSRSAPFAPWWQRLVLWQGVSGLALAAVVTLSSVLVWRESVRSAPDVRYVAVLQDPTGGGNGWVVDMTQVSGASGELRLVPLRRDLAVPQDRVLQFWTKAPGAPGPRSLGLVPAAGVTSLPLQRVPDLQPDQLFEITLEPPGGSTVGRPTGPVLFIGRAVRLTS